MRKSYKFLFLLVFFSLAQERSVFAQTCSCATVTPTYTVDLSSTPDTIWLLSYVANPLPSRSGNCGYNATKCGVASNCIQFFVTLHPQATEIAFIKGNGTANNGEVYINCGLAVGDTCGPPTSINCPPAASSFTVTYCNSGANKDDYTISSSKGFSVTDSTSVRAACTGTLTATGLTNVTWNSVSPGAPGAYNTRLSALSGNTVTVTPIAGDPALIKYLACGNVSGCTAGTKCDTLNVYVSPTLTVTPAATNTVICSGDPNTTINAVASGGSPPYTYSWSPGGETTSAITAGAGTYTVSVNDAAAGCGPVTQTITIASQATPSAPVASASPNPICVENNLTLTASPTGTTYTWNGPNSFSSASQNPAPFSVTSANAGTYSVTATTSGCTSPAGTVSVTVNPIPAAPTAAGTTICSGTSATLTATAPGGTYRWYDAAAGGTLLQTGAGYTTPSLTITTTYYVQTTVNGCTSPRTAVVATVTSLPAAPTASGATICEGTSATLTATAPGGTYQWYDAPSGGTLLQTGATYTTPLLAANETYYVQTTVSGCAGPRTTVAVTVNPTPAATTAAGTVICQGTSTTLTATAPGGTYQWYDAAAGGTLLQTGASYTTPALAATTTYYVQATISGCTGPRTAVVVTVNATPAAPTAAGTTICEGTSATLTATAPGGTYEWYDAAAGGTLLQTGAGYISPALSAGTTYYVQTTISGCDGPRTAVTVTVTPLPAAPTASSATICVGSTAILTATAPGGTYQWYDAAVGGTLLQTGASYTTPALFANTTYYVQTTVNGCAGPRTAVTVVVSAIPAAPTAAGATICEGTSATLTATAPGGTYQWYDAAAGGTLLQTGASYTTPVLAATTSYYVQTTIAGCTGPRTTVTVIVNPTPAAPTAAGTTICEGTSATLTATAPGGTYQWYDAAVGGSLLQTGASYATPVLASNTTYYVQTTISGCAGPRTAVVVTVTPLPAAPTAAGATICEGNTSALTATAPGGTYEWFDAAAGGTLLQTGASYTTPTLTTTTTYYVQTTVSSCAGPRTAVTVTVTPTDDPSFNYSSGTYCQLGTTTPTITGGFTGTFSASPAGLVFVSTSTGEINLATSPANTYTVTFTTDGPCPAQSSQVVTITSTGIADFHYADPFCQIDANPSPVFDGGGTAGTFTVTPAGLSFVSASTGQINLVTTTPGTYTVTNTVMAVGCYTVTATATVTISPAATVNAGTNQTICAGSSVTLGGSFGGSASSATWSGGAGGFSPDPSTLNAVYTPDPGEVTAGTLTLTLTTDDPAGSCLGASDIMVITINPIPVAPTAAGTVICEGNDVTITATAPGGTYQWYDAASGGTLLQTGASYTTPTLTTTATYYVQTTVSSCTGSRTAVTVTVTPTPAAPTAAGVTICEGTSATLTTTAPGGTYEWYDAASGGTLLQTGASYTTPVLASNATYYVQTTVNSCAGPRTAVTVTVTPTPAAPTATGAVICQGTSATLTATAPGGTYQWYNSVSGGTLLQTGASYSTPTLTTTATYYVQTTIAGCAGPRTAVTVTVNPTPVAPTAAGDEICEGTSATLTATAPGGTYEWYDAAVAGALLQTGASYTTAVLAANATYYVQTTISGCVGPRTAVTVTVNPTPAAPTAAGTTICEGTSATLTATAPGGTYEWYDAAVAGALLQTGASYTTPALVANATYYVQTTISGCDGPRTAVTVTVNPTPAAPTATGAVICQGTSATLTATAPGGTYQWYDTPSGGTLLQTGAAYTTPALSADETYYVQTTISGCAGPRTAVTVTVTPTPAAPTAAGTAICAGFNTTLTATAPGGTYEWYDAAVAGALLQTGASYTTPTLTTTTTYYVQTTVSSCVGPRTAVTVTVNQLPIVTSASSATICSGTAVNIPLTSDIASTFTWIAADNANTTGESTTQQTTSTLNNTIINTTLSVQTVSYTVTPTTIANSCEGTAQTVTVTVNPTPSLTAGSNSPVCLGGAINLTATTTGGTTFNWTGPNSFTSTSQNPVISISTTADAGTYSVTTTSAAGCPGVLSTTTVIVNPPPPAPASGSNTPVCVGQTLSLTVATITSASYSWTGPNSFSSTLQDPTITNVTLSANGTYSIIATVPGCGPSSTGTISVTINPAPAAPTAASNSPICSGSDLSLTASTVGSSTYTWSGPGGYTSTLQDPVIVAATTANSGIYSVTATENGCTGVAGTTTVTINAIPVTPTAGSNSAICEGTTLSLTASTIASATYSWSGPNSFTSTAQNPVVAGITLADAGTYSVTATVSGCTGSEGTTVVVVNPIPASPVATNSSPICSGQTLSLTASTVGSATYSWNGPNSFSSTSQNPLIASATTAANGNYSVTATENGCTSPAGTTSVTIDQTPSAPVASNNGPLCIGDDLTLTAATITGATYAWSGPNSFTSASQNPVINNVATSDDGAYSVMATVNGCTGPAGTTSVIVAPPPTTPVTGSNSPVCSGQTLSLTSNTFAGGTYSWTGPSSFSSSLEDPTIAGVTVAATGTYSVFVKIGSCTSATETVSVTINLTPAAPTAGSSSPICSGSDLSLTASIVGGSTYTWNGPNGYSSATQNPIIVAATSAEAGTYSVTATENGCTSTAGTTSVTVNPIPAAPTATNNGPLCVGDNLTLTANTITGATYSWTGPNSFTSASQNPTIANVSTDEAGTYSVSVTVAGCQGSEGTTTLVVAPPPATPTPASNSPVCSGNDLSLTASTIAGATYNWSGPDGFTSTTQDPIIAAITTAGDGTYSVFVQIGSCSSPAGTVSVTINQSPAAPIVSSNSPLCIGDNLSLTASTIGAATYSWNGPNSFTSTDQNPIINGVTTTEAGTYSVSATENGCAGPAGTATVIVNPPPAVPTTGSNSPVCSGQTLSLTANNIAGATYNWSGPNSFTSTSQNPAFLTSTASGGTYSVTATVTGCPTTAAGTITVTVDPTPVAPVATNSSPICSGSDLTLTASTVGSSTYLWSGPAGFSSSAQDPVILAATSAEAGTYSVTATENGCTSLAGITSVTVNPIPAAPVAGNNGPLCVGDDLTLTASIITGATYSWSGPAGFTSTSQNPAITNVTTVEAGTYSVSVSVAGCQGAEGTTTLIVAPPPAAPTPGSNSPVCSGATLSLTSGTIAGATYSWSGPNSFTSSVQDPTIGTVTTAADGTYSVFVMIGSCASPAGTVSVTINQSPAAPIVSSNSPLCAGDNLSLSASTIAGVTYAWNGPNSFSSATQNPVVNAVTTADEGAYSVIATDIGNGCGSAAATVSVTVIFPATVTAGSDQTICANNAGALSGSITGGSGTIAWSTSNGAGIFTNPTSVNATYTPSNNDTLIGDIKLIISSTNNGGCTPAKDTLIMHVNPGPQVNAGPDIAVCAGTSVTLTLNGSVSSAAAGAQWSSSGNGTFNPDNLTLNASYIPGTNDTAIVTLVLTSTGNGQCIAVTDTMKIMMDQKPVAGFSNSSACLGQLITFTDTSAATAVNDSIVSWNWTIDGVSDTLQNPTHTYASVGTDSVTLIVTTARGCTDTVMHVININPTPVAAYTYTVDCLVDSVYFTSTSTITSGNISSHSWNFGDGMTSTLQNPAHSYTTAGTYTVILTVTSDSGCTATASDTVRTCVSVNAGFTSASVSCSGQTIAFTDTSVISGIDSIATWNWNFGDGGTDTLQNTSHSYALGGTYTVTLTVVTNSGAIDSVKHTILINPSPAASYTFLSTCALDSVYFANTSSITGGTITAWNWSFGDGDVSNLQSPVHYYDSTGAYVVVLTATSDSGCTSTFTDSVMYANDVIAGFSHVTDCQFNALFNDTSLLASSDSVTSWNWNFGDGNSDTIENPLHTYTASGTYTAELIVISSGGCTDTISNTVSIIAPPLADFIPAGGAYYQGESINFTDLSTNAVSWVWNFGDGASDTVQNISHTYDQNGILDVMLIVMNTNGCPDTANYSFTIYPNTVGVPTAFTPNGDNVNDVLHVMGGPLSEMDWRIYNEWGNEVFHSTDQAIGWDAHYKGKLQPATRYVYTLTGTTVSGDAITLHGEVTIVR